MHTVTNAINKAIYGDNPTTTEGDASRIEGNTQRTTTGTGHGRETISDNLTGHPDTSSKYKSYEPASAMRSAGTMPGGTEQIIDRDTETATGYGKAAPSSNISGFGGHQENIPVDHSSGSHTLNRGHGVTGNTEPSYGNTTTHDYSLLVLLKSFLNFTGAKS